MRACRQKTFSPARRRTKQKKTAQRSDGQADKNCSSPARRRTKPIKTAQRAINCAERKGRQFLPSSCFRFSFEREIFRSDKSFLFRTTFGVRHFFSALSGSFGHLCTSRNARVPLRYASQPFRRKPAPSRSLKAAWFCFSNRFYANLII